MYDWRKEKNFRRVKNEDDTTTYLITVYGKDFEVSEEIYRMYARYHRKSVYMEYDLKVERYLRDKNGNAVKDSNGIAVMLPEREISYEMLLNEGWEFQSPDPLPEEIIFPRNEVEGILLDGLDMLTNNQKSLVKALFYDGYDEEEYAEILGVSRQAVNKLKMKVINKLKKIHTRGLLNLTSNETTYERNK